MLPRHLLFIGVGLAMIWGVYTVMKDSRQDIIDGVKAIPDKLSDTVFPSLDSATQAQRDANPAGSFVSDALDNLAEFGGWLTTVPTQVKAKL